MNTGRVLEELRELHRLTGGEGGAQRVCWTETWQAARRWFAGLLDGLPLQTELDAAGNSITTLRGESPRTVVIGGHLDSVPNGGWLDGALGVLAGLEVLRAIASEGTPPLTVKLIDWADEEGARFGYGMLGSSAVSGTLDLDSVRRLRDRDGEELPAVLRRNGVDLETISAARSSLADALAYVELHIEQGPVLERLGLPLAVVLGTCGVERHIVRFTGKASHSGATPMADRRDALAAAARLLLSVREPAREEAGLVTVGRCVVEPGIPTAVAGATEITVDQRHLDAAVLARLLDRAKEDSVRIAAEEGVAVEWSWLWGIEPVAFDPTLIGIAEEAILELAGSSHRMASGPLHDAAEVARAGVPTVMLFVQSLGGLSHNKDEDTLPEHVELSARALGLTVKRVIEQM